MRIMFNLTLILCLSFSCSKGKVDNPSPTVFLESIQIENADVVDIHINNREQQVTLTFYENQDLSNIDFLFFPHDDFQVLGSNTNRLTLNLETTSTFKLTSTNENIEFTLVVKLVPTSFRQSSFVISTFHGVWESPTDDLQILENTKKANFTHFETTFTTPSTSIHALQIAENLGLKVIVQDYSRFGGFQNYDSQIAKTTTASVIEAVEMYSKYESFEGYYVWDEPFLEQLPQVKRDLDLLNLHDPGKLFLVVTLQSYSPTYTWENGQYTRYIDELLSVVQPPFLCTNYYVFEQDIKQGVKLEDSQLWKDWGYIRKKAMEREIPFWFYIQMMGDILKGEVGNITVAEIAVQNYIALALGANGISYYNTINGIFDGHGTPNYLFQGVAELNKETMVIGNALLEAVSKRVYPTKELLHGDYLDKISDSDLVSNAPEGLVIGEFRDATALKYLMIVNTDYINEKSGVITLHSNQITHKINKVNGEKELVNNLSTSFDFNLNAGEGELYVLSAY